MWRYNSVPYVYLKRNIYYFSRRVPSDLQTRFNKGRVTISLRTRSFKKAEKSAKALSDRLERYWDGKIMVNNIVFELEQ